MSTLLGRFLDPIDVLFAVFYAILFALLFTLSYSVLLYRGFLDAFASGYGRDLFLAILGAVAAWGMIDATLYALTEVFARRERYRLLRYVQASDDDESAVAAIADELDFILQPITTEEQRDALYHDVLAHLSQAEPQAVGVQREDLVGAAAIVVVSVVAVLPSLLPLLLLSDTALAIRVSNLVSFVVIFATGYTWGVHTDANPWKTGLLLASVCLAMVLVAMLLGG